jgi:signal transduction histidine kinase
LAILIKSLERELILVREELRFEKEENRKQFAELIAARSELSFQKDERGKRAAELGIANIELAFEDGEKGKRAEELGIANIELLFQNEEKEKRAAELSIANIELVFQNEEKEKRAAELGIANIELLFQNDEKEKRAAELSIANIELTFQNGEKEKRAAELIIANKELAFQNEEKEKRAEELVIINTELLAFNYISSHDLQEPLRKIQILAGRIIEKETENLSDIGKDYFHRIQIAAGRMRQLIEDLLAYSRTNIAERKFQKIDLNIIIEEVKAELKENIEEKHAIIEATEMCEMNVIPFQFRQLMHNLLRNALKFSSPKRRPHILIKSRIVKGNKLNNAKLVGAKSYCHISVTDNGIGFEPEYKDRIFEVFQKLHSREKYEGTGIGLAIVKKIVENHNGIVTAKSRLNKGATFDIYIPVSEEVYPGI